MCKKVKIDEENDEEAYEGDTESWSDVISLEYLEVGPLEMRELAPSKSGHDLEDVISTTE